MENLGEETQDIRMEDWQAREKMDRNPQYSSEIKGEEDIYSVYISQNNLGVMMLRQKRYHDAANCFCKAVKYVNERSIYYCEGHNEYHMSTDPPCDLSDVCRDQHSSRPSSPLPMSDESEFPDIDALSVTPDHYGVNDLPSNRYLPQRRNSLAHVPTSSNSDNNYTLPRTQLDSFYLLLDEENGFNGNETDDSSGQSSNPKSCNENHKETSSLLSPNHSTRSLNDDKSLSEEGETFVFRNPIMVSKRRVYRVPESSHATEESTATATAADVSMEESSTEATRNTAVTTIDKESCAKLSLVSVYNMALTYHIAALDTQDNAEDETKNNCNRVQRRNSLTHVPTTADARALAAAASSGGTNGLTHRPFKKRKSITMTPYGECNGCDGPCNVSTSHSCDCQANSSTSTEADNAVDQVLLSQALAYYEIAYRILVSEQRVLVSQAMVILNNIGHIHRLMGNEDHAKSCFQRLLTTMVYLQQTGDANKITHWENFLTNVLDYVIPTELSHKRFAAAA